MTANPEPQHEHEPSLRLFIAIELPDDVKRALAATIALLRAEAPPRATRWVDPDGIHLTLKFLGATAAARVPEITSALRRAAASTPRFMLQAEGLQAFHGSRGGPLEFRSNREAYPHNITVVFTGIGDGYDESVALAQGVEDAISPLGFPTEKRAFFPHLTLARVPRAASRDERISLAEALRPFFWHPRFDQRPPRLPAAPGFEVENVSLMQSTLRPSGAEYRCLAEAPLAA
jgi:2'-5' RNA ligase